MPLQLGTMSARARAKRIESGRNHGSGRTLAQADKSLKVYDHLTPELKAQLAMHGYGAADLVEMGDGRNALLESSVQREAVESEAATQAYGRAVKCVRRRLDPVGPRCRSTSVPTRPGPRPSRSRSGSDRARGRTRTCSASSSKPCPAPLSRLTWTPRRLRFYCLGLFTTSEVHSDETMPR